MRRSGHLRRCAIALACALVFANATASADTKPGVNGLAIESIGIRATRVEAFERSQPSRQTFGKLEFRGGLVLTSATTAFGGWSGLEIDPDGRTFLAVSDAGAWLTAEFVYAASRLAGIQGARLGPILGLGGKRLPVERDRDAEGVRLLEGTLTKGSVLVSFEQNHRIGRFEINGKGLQQPTSYVARSPDWSPMRRNKGLEAVAVVRGGPVRGAIVAFAERLIDSGGHHTGWIWPGGLSSEPKRLSLRRIGDFDVTDAAALPDGALVVLERSFAWLAGVKMRLRLIPAAEVRPGALLDGEMLIEAGMAYEIDNMEGLAIHRGPRGEAILTLISDDNFNGFLQRTLMLQFALPMDKVSAAAPR